MGYTKLPEAITAPYTRQIILAVFTEANGLDALSLADETLRHLMHRDQCLPVIMEFHCSIGSLPVENGKIRAGSLHVSQEVLKAIRDAKWREWYRADDSNLHEVLNELRSAIEGTAQRYQVRVTTWDSPANA
ncbi:hypothetical protein BBO_09275 [Beauveria brongniartii RCEF 3172]|uniref:Uncharacterized protein n=1 Tax=Beauveria brongniartii RCEF 3172 TaxID=1081107 RepID=A0A166W215_9HYPO|nr:hypothetical protein BBO_09275 [Beauveria brongniartii RCEF 3172]